MKIIKIQNHIIQESQKVINQAVKNCSEPFEKITEKALPSYEALNITHFPKYAICQSHKADGGIAVCTDLSYVSLEKNFVPEYEYTHKKLVSEIMPDGKKKLLRKTVTETVPAHWEEYATWLPHYYIDKLYTTGKGSGTNTVQTIVRQSLQDPKTQGRVMLDACCIDGQTSPGGFYYKLGFRFINEKTNLECEKWLSSGGRREDAPWATGLMYLPKENISHCLNYKVK